MIRRRRYRILKKKAKGDGNGHRSKGARLVLALATVAAILVPSVAAQADDRTVVYLTFDDGPSYDNGTAEVLEVLARYDIKATFFMVGRNVSQDPAQAQAVAAAGHAIGNHTWDHSNLTDPQFSASDIQDQLASTQAVITDLGIPAPICYRPTFGATNPQIQQIMADMGMEEVLWTLDTRDWERQGTEPIINKLELITDHDNVLMHDGHYNGAETALALDEFLEAHGTEYDFRILPECGDSTPGPIITTTTTPVTPTTQPGGNLIDTEHCRYGPEPGFFDVTDAKAGSVYRLYCSYFGRMPDQGGFDYWNSVLDNTSSLTEISAFFLQSREFQITYGDLSDQDYVNLIYQNVLGRAPDSAGATYWTNKLSQENLGREIVLLLFSESPELKNLSGTA